MTKRKSNDAFDKGLEALIKQFGKGYGQRGLAEVQAKAIPTGHDDLDCLLTKGAHGIYLGGIIELLGSEGSGKSSLALRTVGNAQKMGYRCCWLDCEAAFDENLAVLNGVDPTQLILPELTDTTVLSEQSDDEEGSITFFNVYKILEMVYQSVISGLFGLIVLDSVAALMPERILDKNFDPNKAAAPAEVARALRDMLRKIALACKRCETSVIFINQKRDQPGAWMQNPYHTPGGKALKFFAHQRISVEKINGAPGQVWADIDDKKELIGHYARAKIIKNKKAPPVPPGVDTEIPIYYREYFPDEAERCYKLSRQLQVVTIRNGVLTWKSDADIILQEKGESVFLAKIREGKLEPKLAAACVEVEESEKNQNKKTPVLVPKTIRDLAATFDPAVEKKAKSASKAKPPAIDIDEDKV